ncbi:type II secretion system protein E [Candidatus Saccharibacteria bacterium RIFCSPHIGHO2_12_FULL_48_21]|nr:MAG: type II secretion system protein E [Candidatus Saccharibacteria bacterium RIFCSPHIGHO2_12_FULL_48_21]
MNVLSASTQQQVEDTVVADGLITKAKLQELRDKAKYNSKPLLGLLLSEGHITDEQLTKVLAEVNNVPYVNLSAGHIDPKVLELLSADIAEHYMAVPLGEMQQRLVVAMLDAGNVQAVDFLSNKIGRPLKVYAASETGIRRVLAQYSGTLGKGISSMLTNAPSSLDDDSERGGIAISTAERFSQSAAASSPIGKALSAIMDYAAKNKASDVHIEPLEKEIKVRCRVDGVLREIMRLPKSAEAPLVSRVKILSNLKIDEHRIPQDGQFSIRADNRPIDLRIAISPTVWGEQIILRLLDKSGTSLKLEELGYGGRALRSIRRALLLPHGMILTSGPTGSGKSTSMYAMISEIKNDAINIVTLEDPVEYKMEGVNQIQVNPNVGLTFATGLRSILRQDPDVVMVGEIRDRETAALAVQAALTGHLVFATLHTNNAAGILPRLLDMGIEPFLIASTVHTVIGQRLVRTVVPGGETYSSNKAETLAINQVLGNLLPETKEEVPKVATDLGYRSLPLAGQNAYTLVKGKITPENPTGFEDRVGLHEVFDITEEIQELILKHSTSSAIQRAAMSQGMVTMRQDGYLKALAGRTTLSEVNRVAAGEA